MIEDEILLMNIISLMDGILNKFIYMGVKMGPLPMRTQTSSLELSLISKYGA